MLVLIRHGQSLYNKAGMFTGTVDSKLSMVGVEQAKSAGILLKEKGLRFDIAYSSHLSRAYDTAQFILEQTFSVCDIIEDKRLAERDYGEWSGKKKQDLFLEHGEKMFKLYRRSYRTAPSGAESLHDVVERVKRWLPQLKNHTGKNVLVVSHGNTMRALSVAFGFHDEKTVEGYEIETGQPILLEWTNLEKRF
jgi:2,3-bisphosphoglycerate-dependent phosphoglycerate mutase